MISLFGRYQDLMLFTDGDNAVVVDLAMNMVNETGKLSNLSSIYAWSSEDLSYERLHSELATGALSDLKVHTITASGRLYTIPKAAQEEAKRGLEWRKEHKRGGTPVGVNSARILANGGQIGLKKVRHIAKYFPRHEVDKKGKGYKPGDDGFPSAGRIAWALWGGDAAWRWARQIVERENAKALKAGADYDFDYDYDELDESASSLNIFKEAFELGEDGPQFVARLRLDGSGFDRLYAIDQDGNASVWDDGAWDDLGHIQSDIETYDRSLDDEDDFVEKAHMFVDADTAVTLSAFMQERPFSPVTIYDLDPEEATLHEETLSSVDWEFIDSTLVAAVNPDDGVYTPEERSANVKKQVRDATGRFSKMGSRVAVGGNKNKQGSIIGINPDKQTVKVKMDDGSVSEVPGGATQTPESIKPGDDGDQLGGATADNLGLYGPLDTSGILGQPRAPISSPNARIPGTLPALSRDQLHSVLYNYPAWVKSQRDAYKSQRQPTGPSPSKDVDDIKSDYIAQRGQQTGVNLWEGDYREHPMFADLFEKNPSYNLYYNPLYAAGEPQSALSDDKPKTAKDLIESAPEGTGEPITPETSDVRPMYLAVVSPDDPSAVFDLISIVPAGTNSTTPTVFKRVDKKWEKDDKILSDLMSATPPPVVPLHGSAYEEVLTQIDESSIRGSAYEEFAQGGLDKNRGKAEKLRRYWVYGRGAAKIRWGMPGDWSRCVRHLAKYMGPRAKGYCNLRHKDALKMYPATHAKLLRGGKNNSTAEFVMFEPVYEIFGRSNEKPKTVITAKDLQTSLFDINRTADEMFDAEWEPDEEIILILGDPEVYKLELEPMTAAFVEGGLDRNRGQAEKLRRYWLYGRGALKIRWNTPGDWTRCYRNLAKYMGVRAKGYCSLRHKEATGVWPGSKYNVGKRNIRGSAFEDYTVISEDDLFEKMFLKATMDKARERVIMAGGSVEQPGAKFYIPLVIPEAIESGDGRKFDKGSIEYRDLPLPLLWQIKTADGHNGSVVVGRIDHMERTDDGIGNAHGVFDSGPYGREAERMLREGFIRGVSADLDQFEASEDEDEDEDKELESKSKKKKIGGNKIGITHARVMAVTMVPKPAFQECKIYLEESMSEGEKQEEDMNKVPDGIYVDDEISRDDAFAIVACGAIAGSIPTVPPATWFANPQLDKPTPLTVDDNGRVFGHIAAWHVNHIGMTAGTRPPRSKSKYAYFHTGVVRADDGSDYPVGQLTLAGGHASLEASAVDAARHYDDTGSAIADVHAGEDSHGIWVAGALRPNATPEQIRSLRASAPSGDWRPINGTLELVAVCQVNVPGFPIARARVASGQVYALVAAGAAALAKLRPDPITELADRVALLEKHEKDELSAQIEELRARVASVRGETNSKLAVDAEELSNSIRERIAIAESKMTTTAAAKPVSDDIDLRARVASAQAMLEFGDFSDEARERLAKEGKALPNGSYPIRNESDLKNAIQAYGRSKPSDRAKVRRHIMKRARALGKSDIVPEKWKSASAMIDEDAELLRARIASISGGVVAAGEEEDTDPKAVSGGRQKYISGVNQPRDAKGKFRQVLARLKQDLGVSGLQNVVEKVEEVENLDSAGNYKQAAASAQELVKLIDRLDSGALNATSLENIRNSTRLLGEIMANLPLPFGESAQKVRFSDLPPVLKNLIDDMIDRVEDKIGKEEADVATEKLRKYKGGGDMFSQGEVASEMNVLLRLLT